MVTGGVRMSRLLASGKVKPVRGGVCLDLYNNAAYEKVCCTVTTRINLSNHYWVLTAKRIE